MKKYFKKNLMKRLMSLNRKTQILKKSESVTISNQQQPKDWKSFFKGVKALKGKNIENIPPMGGLADGKKESDFDPIQLYAGEKVELKEHANNNPTIAKKISADHLTEHPQYYPALKEMEENLDKRGV